MSFYLTYRPQRIDEVDNDTVRTQLLSLLSKEKKDLPHAYFFRGPKGSGKTTSARIIAKLFNCQNPTDSGPCGTCPSCISISQGNSLDVLEMDAASNRGIDDVRELRERIKLAPAVGPYKVYIIDEVHMMTQEAFNALLKTLEEPPPHAIFILATTDPQKVPPTIQSRCTEVIFSKASDDQLLHALERIAAKEKIAVSKEGLDVIVQMADGAFRDGVKLLEQASLLPGPLTPESIMAAMKKTGAGERTKFLDQLLTRLDASRAIRDIEALVGGGTDMSLFLTDCLADLQDALVSAYSDTKPRQGWDPRAVRALSQAFMEAYAQLRISPIPQLPIELAVVAFVEAQRVASVQAPASPAQLVQEAARSVPAQEQEDHDRQSVKIDPTAPLNIEKLTTHWPDFIEALKPYNHSVAGVIRSAKPRSVENGVVIVEAFYAFHKERLSDPNVRAILSTVLKKLFGVDVKVEVVLGKK